MALIKKILVECNKCGLQAEDQSPNVSVLGEEFFLCESCLESLLTFMTGRVGDIKKYERGPVTKHSSTNFKWDEASIELLVEKHMMGMSPKEIANEYRVTDKSVNGMIYRIRHSQPGSNLYPYKKYFIEEASV